MPDAITETQLVHDVHRRAATLLADAAQRPDVPASAVTELRDFLVPMLHHHHETEDELIWPVITQAAPELTDGFDTLSDQHDELASALDRLAAAERPESFGVAAAEVRRLVHHHLDDEEPLLLPALRDHVSPAVWEALSEHVIATAPKVSPHLLFGLFDVVGEPGAVEQMLAALPAPTRAMAPELRSQGADALLVLAGGR
jgi:hypothetical protein